MNRLGERLRKQSLTRYRTNAALLTTVGMMLLFSFNNCQNTHDVTAASEQQQSICRADFEKLFQDTYYAHVRLDGMCVKCHSEAGPSPFYFAHTDPKMAYGQFTSLGIAKIEAIAVDSTHGEGLNGPGQQQAFDTLKLFWEEGQSEFATCMTGQSPGPTDLVQTKGYIFDDMYFSNNTTQTYTWDLALPENLNKGSTKWANLSLSARILYETINGVQTATGYVFSNPRLSAQNGDEEFVIEGLYVKVNGRIVTELPDFAAVTNTATGLDGKFLTTQGQAFNVRLDKISNVDKISLTAKKLITRPRTDNPILPADPTLTLGSAFSRNGTIAFTLSAPTARRWCLTTINSRPARATEPCPGMVGAPLTTNGWYTAPPPSPYNLGISSVLAPDTVYNVYLWIADSNLLINTNAAIGTVTYDPVAPVAPAITSVTVTDTQVAAINIAAHADEPNLRWCVLAAASNDNNPGNGGCVFTATKPSRVSLPRGGESNVVVFVRDLAGNTSGGSAIVKANNPFGQIRYAHLASNLAVDVPRNIFRTACYSCHEVGSTNTAGTNALLIDSYAAVVAAEAKIKTQLSTPNATHSGIITDQKFADLIRLWFDQTGTPVQ